MELSEKFKNLLDSKYIFHLHTTYTDGLSSVKEYCSWASKNRYDAVVFTEHVRRKLSYDFHSFLSDIENARREFPDLDIWTGVEAKVLPGGELDMPERILSKIDIICFAYHFFPTDLDLFDESFERLFSDARWKKHIRVWVHPGNYLKKSGVLDDHLDFLDKHVLLALQEGVFIEHNLIYDLPPMSIIKKIPQSKLIKGLDAHSVKSIVEMLKKH